MSWKNPPSDNPIIRQVVNRLHVSADDQEVETAVRKAIRKSKRNSPEADAMVQEGIKHHKHNREVFVRVIGGI